MTHITERLNKEFGAHYELGDRRDWVTSARTYFYEDEHVCDSNVAHFIDGINTVSGEIARSSPAVRSLLYRWTSVNFS